MHLMNKVLFHNNNNTPDFGSISVSKIQRKYNIGFDYALNIMNSLYINGYVGEENGYKPRKLLCDENIIWNYIENNLSSLRPSNYDSIYGPQNNGGLYITETTRSYDEMTGLEFEHFCADVLKKNAFYNVEVTQGSGDHGIDILAEKDDISYAIQCKCYSSNIGNAAIQQAHTGRSLYQRDIAVVLTNQYFTQQAKDEAKVLGVKLWDRDTLNNMLSKTL